MNNDFQIQQKGFSLLELLLVVMVFAVLLTGALTILDDWVKTSVDQEVAQEVMQLQMAAEAYVDLNFQNLLNTQVPAIGDDDEIDITADIIANGFLPTGYQALNSFKQPMRVFIRRTNDAAYDEVIEVVTLSDGIPKQDNRLFSAARAGGSKLGVLSCRDLNSGACLTTGIAIRGVSGAWALPLSQVSSYTTAPNANGGYMAAYGRVTDEQILTDQYLFRVEDTNFPEANTMETNLRMNNNDITDASIIVADQINVAGNAEFTGADSSGLSSPYILSVRDNLESQDMTISNSSDNGMGNVIIEGEDNAGVDFDVSGNLQANLDGNSGGTGTVSADGYTTTNLNMPANPGSPPSMSFDTLDMNNQQLATSGSGNIYSTDFNGDNAALNYGGTLNAITLQVSQFNGEFNSITTDRIVTGTISTDNDAVFSGDIEVDNNFITGGMTADTMTGSTQMSITDMTCGDTSACP